MKKIILFDSIIDGHHSDYLSHPIRYWKENEPVQNQLIVVTSEAFRSTFNELASGHENIIFDPINEEVRQQLLQSNAFKRSFDEWSCVVGYNKKHLPTHTLLMYFDLFQVGIAWGASSPTPVSGIYFRPDFHYQHTTLKSKINSFRKKFFLQQVLKRKAFKNLFCLDQSAVKRIQSFTTHPHIIPLPDPVAVHPQTPEQIRQLGVQLQLDPYRQSFLLFGHLDDRKGIEPFLKAVQLLPSAQQQKVSLILAGRPASESYRQHLDTLIANLPSTIQVIRFFDKVPEKQIQTFFDLSDYVLALYQNHVGMASVVIRAAVSKKPVIGANYGYLKEVIEKEQLGVTVESTSPEAIATLLADVLETGVSYSVDIQEKFAQDNSVEAFTRTLFSRL